MIKKQHFIPSGNNADGTFRPQLTSLVDIMAIILIFLIKTFSTEGSVITPSSDLELPISTSTKQPKPQWSIEIARGMVISEGIVIASTKSFAKSDTLLIPELYKWLEKKRTQREDSTRQILLQCDREVPYAIVKKVMYTCSTAKFTDFSVLVLREE